MSMMQPAFMPWQGYFELIYRSEKFIFLDDFQFSVQSYHQRNRLFTSLGHVDWYTVPVKKTDVFGQALDAAQLGSSGIWRKKMLARIKHNYYRSDYYARIMPGVERWLQYPSHNLSDLNMRFINYVLELFSWRREIVLSSQLASKLSRSERVVELLRWSGATRYFCARGSFGYMAEDGVFPLSDIETLFQDYIPVPYKQIGSPKEFVPRLSILDALFNIGPEETASLVKNGTERWSTWKEMCQLATEVRQQ